MSFATPTHLKKSKKSSAEAPSIPGISGGTFAVIGKPFGADDDYLPPSVVAPPVVVRQSRPSSAGPANMQWNKGATRKSFAGVSIEKDLPNTTIRRPLKAPTVKPGAKAGEAEGPPVIRAPEQIEELLRQWLSRNRKLHETAKQTLLRGLAACSRVPMAANSVPAGVRGSLRMARSSVARTTIGDAGESLCVKKPALTEAEVLRRSIQTAMGKNSKMMPMRERSAPPEVLKDGSWLEPDPEDEGRTSFMPPPPGPPPDEDGADVPPPPVLTRAEFRAACSKMEIHLQRIEVGALFDKHATTAATADSAMELQLEAFVEHVLKLVTLARLQNPEDEVLRGPFLGDGSSAGPGGSYQGKIKYHPSRSAVYAPSGWDGSLHEITAQLPDEGLELEFVYGCGASRMVGAGNLGLISTGELVYGAAAIGVLYNPRQQTQRHFTGHSDAVRSVAVHPNGQYVATGQAGSIPVVCVWDAEPGAALCPEMARLVHDRGDLAVTTLAFSPDGDTLVSIVTDSCHTVYLWGWRRGERIATLVGMKGIPTQVFGVEWSPTKSSGGLPGRFVTFGSQHIKWWTKNDEGKWIGRQAIWGNAPKQDALSAAFLPSGHLVSGHPSGDLYVWEERRCLKVLAPQLDGAKAAAVRAMQLLPGEDVLVAAHGDGTFAQWDTSVTPPAWVSAVKLPMPPAAGLTWAAPPDDSASSSTAPAATSGTFFVATTAGGIWEVPAGAVLAGAPGGAVARPVPRLLHPGHTGCMHSLAFDPIAEGRFASACDGGHVVLWDCARRAWEGRLRVPARPSREVQCVAFSARGEHLAVGLADGSVHVYLAGSEATPAGSDGVPAEGAGKLGGGRGARGSCGRGQWGGSRGGDLGGSWTGKPREYPLLCTLRSADRAVTEMKYSPDGKRLAVASRARSVELWLVNTHAQAGALYTRSARCIGHTSTVTDVDFSVDGQLLMTNSAGREILYFDVRTGRQVVGPRRDTAWHTWTCPLGFPVMGIWNSTDGSDVGGVNTVCRANAGSVVGTGDDFGMIRMMRWPAVVAEPEVVECGGHASHITSVRFAPRDEWLCTAGGGDRTAQQPSFRETGRGAQRPSSRFPERGEGGVWKAPATFRERGEGEGVLRPSSHFPREGMGRASNAPAAALLGRGGRLSVQQPLAPRGVLKAQQPLSSRGGRFKAQLLLSSRGGLKAQQLIALGEGKAASLLLSLPPGLHAAGKVQAASEEEILGSIRLLGVSVPFGGATWKRGQAQTYAVRRMAELAAEMRAKLQAASGDTRVKKPEEAPEGLIWGPLDAGGVDFGWTRRKKHSCHVPRRVENYLVPRNVFRGSMGTMGGAGYFGRASFIMAK
ncbi:hypothetical protein CYMTET_3343 [Cymbomonas tetramitiformis]|uniref:HELP domain-containing protein n=1 Tax=Cymbomonas tetramitiformis TaxID=36881 RepID=A0AAE0H3B2_9CHLO|nr:hypothetical protein CYMTET_3343 [Cymbomonas tetramitiformis]